MMKQPLAYLLAVVAFLPAAAERRVAHADGLPAEESLYSAELTSGQRIVGARLTNWGVTDHPRLDGRPLHDPDNPIRWLREDTADRPALPDAYLEMVGGDVMPGRVVGLGISSTVQEGELGSFLLVAPTTPVNRPDGSPRGTIRVLTRWLRRIVWQRRAHDQYQPSMLFFKDGRQLAYRSIRFRDVGITVLTDNGRRDVPFAELAELHLPRSDWWNAYFEQVALLTPECKLRLMRLETLDGLRATVSPDRIQIIPWGDPNNQDFWYQAVQPAWSMDALFLRHTRILLRQYFGPHQVPLSMVEPSQTRLRSALAVGWQPRIDHNVQGGPLISGGEPYGWGIGTQAYTEMEFPLPTCAVSFRSIVGLDRVVGNGGCARAIVYADKAQGRPLFRSDHLIGSATATDTGLLPLSPGGANPRLVIVSHPDSADRPAGADPLDIRDVVDWLEPQVNLDLESLRAETRGRLPRLAPGLDGWAYSGESAAGGEDGRMTFATRWDNASQSFHFEFRPETSAITLSRSIRIEPNQNWILLYASRNAADNITSPTQAVVRIDGKPVGDFNVPPRWQPDPPPLEVPVQKFHGRQVTLEVRLLSRGNDSYVDWRSMAIVERLPTLFEAFEDEVLRPVKLTAVDGEAAVVTEDHYSGAACIKVSGNAGKEPRGVLSNFNLPIRENPRFGEYRYLRFAWRKSGGRQIGLDLDYLLTDNGQNNQADRWRRIDQLRRLEATTAERRQLESVIQMLEKQSGNDDARASNRSSNLQRGYPVAGARPGGAMQLTGLRNQLERFKQAEASLQSQQDAMDQELTGAAGAAVRSHLRYYTGIDASLPSDTRGVKVADSAPEQWSIVTCDLAHDCGEGRISAISLVCPDGDYALLDHVYLARTLQDFDRCPPASQ